MAVSGKTAAPSEIPYLIDSDIPDMGAGDKAVAERVSTILEATNRQPLSWLKSGTKGQLVICDATGAPAYKAMKGDGTIDEEGNFQLGSKVVGTNELGDKAVTTAKLDDGAVTPAKLSDWSVKGFVGANGLATEGEFTAEKTGTGIFVITLIDPPPKTTALILVATPTNVSEPTTNVVTLQVEGNEPVSGVRTFIVRTFRAGVASSNAFNFIATQL